MREVRKINYGGKDYEMVLCLRRKELNQYGNWLPVSKLPVVEHTRVVDGVTQTVPVQRHHIDYKPREDVEGNADFVQLVGFVVLRDLLTGKYRYEERDGKLSFGELHHANLLDRVKDIRGTNLKLTVSATAKRRMNRDDVKRRSFIGAYFKDADPFHKVFAWVWDVKDLDGDLITGEDAVKNLTKFDLWSRVIICAYLNT